MPSLEDLDHPRSRSCGMASGYRRSLQIPTASQIDLRSDGSAAAASDCPEASSRCQRMRRSLTPSEAAKVLAVLLEAHLQRAQDQRLVSVNGSRESGLSHDRRRLSLTTVRGQVPGGTGFKSSASRSGRSNYTAREADPAASRVSRCVTYVQSHRLPPPEPYYDSQLAHRRPHVDLVASSARHADAPASPRRCMRRCACCRGLRSPWWGESSREAQRRGLFDERRW